MILDHLVLLSRLNQLASVIQVRGNLIPALSCVRLESDGKVLTIQAASMERGNEGVWVFA